MPLQRRSRNSLKRAASDPTTVKNKNKNKKRSTPVKRAVSDPPTSAALKRRNKSRSKNRSRSSRKICGICLEPLLHEFGKTSCGHVFHNHCVCKWFKRSHLCPFCRKKIPPREIKKVCEAVYKNPFASFLRENRRWFKLEHFVGPRKYQMSLRDAHLQVPGFIEKYRNSNEEGKEFMREYYYLGPRLAIMNYC